MNRYQTIVAVAGLMLVWGAGARAGLVIDTVPVGNPGNAADTRHETPGYGAVDYSYSMGTYEVTAGQYCEFLNAVADNDTYGLYNSSMWRSSRGCMIQYSGSPGHRSYSVAPDWADRPVNFVCWSDVARFCNWLHNGQPTGPQGLGTTEDGSYFLDGATSVADLMGIEREPDATWVIPTEDEWYKAAYYDGTDGSYYEYPTSSDSVPSKFLLTPDPGNNATFRNIDYTIGATYWRTKVGDHENSESPCGTFDQGGNVYEWNEGLLGSSRCIRGGSFYYSESALRASSRGSADPKLDNDGVGFRVALIPEPASLTLLASGGVILLRRSRLAR